MASADIGLSEAELAICRLIEETSGHETPKILGLGCVASFEFGTLHSYFLIASNQVLAKTHLRAIENQVKDKSERRKPTVKVVAEFLGKKNRTRLKCKPLSDLYRYLEEDIFESNGIIYVALAKLNERKSSLLSRSLKVINWRESRKSSMLWDQLRCLVYRGESRTQQKTNAAFSTRAYDLQPSESVLLDDDTRFPWYFLLNEEKKPFLKEDDFEEGEKPLGAIIVNKDYQLVGFLNFDNKRPSPVFVKIVTECIIEGDQSPTEEYWGSLTGKLKDLSLQNEKEVLHSPTQEMPRIDIPQGCGVNVSECIIEGDHLSTEHYWSSSTGKLCDLSLQNVKEVLHIPPQEIPRTDIAQRCSNDKGKHLFLLDFPVKEEHANAKRSTSLSRKKRHFELSDPLAKTILDHLELLEGLCRCLDKEYKYGACKCWKHIAEYFNIGEQEYESFKCSQIHSPTEVMFEYLQTSYPDITVGDIKAGLHSIGRQDAIGVLLKYEQTYHTLNGDTLVCSLFKSDPDIIGEVAFILDRQTLGLKNWSHLASKLGIPRNVFTRFETFNTENPTKELFEMLTIYDPRLTVGKLLQHLEDLQRRDVVNAISQSTMVTNDSLLKDLMADLDVMDNVCGLLNRKQRANKLKGWRNLGSRFGIKKEILDDLIPMQEELVGPTEALIRRLGASMPFLTIADFIWAVHVIDRHDVLEILDAYLPDGCISNLLKSCGCERCQSSRLEEAQ